MVFSGFLKERSGLRSRLLNSSGVTVVETSVVTMSLLFMIFGIMEGGRFMSMQQTVTNAAREGASLSLFRMTQRLRVACPVFLSRMGSQ